MVDLDNAPTIAAASSDDVPLIGRLPKELFLATLKHLSPPHQPRKFLIAATHVCRRWREVATGAPILWTAISLQNGEMAATFLKRSGTMPLIVYCPPGGNLKLIQDHLHRVRRLYVENVFGGIEHLAHSLRHAAPMLEELNVSSESWVPSYRLHVFPAETTPSLRSLHFRGVFDPSVGLLTRNIRSLYLGNLCPYRGFGCRALLAVLRSSPALETLSLTKASGDDAQADHGPAVSLPHLRHMDVESVKSSFFQALLRHLDLPGSATIKYTLMDGMHSIDEPFTPSDVEPIRTISSAQFTVECTSSNLARSDVEFVGRASSNAHAAVPCLHVILGHCDPCEEAPHAEVVLAPLVRLSGITRLRVLDSTDRAAPNIGWWTRALAELHALERLDLVRPAHGRTFLRLLCGLAGVGGPVCPALVELFLWDVVCERELWGTLKFVAIMRCAQGCKDARVYVGVRDASPPTDEDARRAAGLRVEFIESQPQ